MPDEARVSQISTHLLHGVFASQYFWTINPLVAEYRALPADSDHLGDAELNHRKCEILRELDELANDPEVSQLLLELLLNPLEFDLARVEAIQIAGIYVKHPNPLADRIWAQLKQ